MCSEEYGNTAGDACPAREHLEYRHSLWLWRERVAFQMFLVAHPLCDAAFPLPWAVSTHIRSTHGFLCQQPFWGSTRSKPVEAAAYSCVTPGGKPTAWLQIPRVFCCGTLIKLLCPAGVLWCCEGSGLGSPPPPAFRCKSALCSFLIIALHPALGFQRHPGKRVCSGCNLDCTLFVLTVATRYNCAV